MKPKDKCKDCPRFGKGRCIGDEVLAEKAEAILDALEDENGAVDLEASLLLLGMAAGALIAMVGEGDGRATAEALMGHMQDITDAVNKSVENEDLPEDVRIPPREQCH